MYKINMVIKNLLNGYIEYFNKYTIINLLFYVPLLNFYQLYKLVYFNLNSALFYKIYSIHHTLVNNLIGK